MVSGLISLKCLCKLYKCCRCLYIRRHITEPAKDSSIKESSIRDFYNLLLIKPKSMGINQGWTIRGYWSRMTRTVLQTWQTVVDNWHMADSDDARKMGNWGMQAIKAVFSWTPQRDASSVEGRNIGPKKLNCCYFSCQATNYIAPRSNSESVALSWQKNAQSGHTKARGVSQTSASGLPTHVESRATYG